LTYASVVTRESVRIIALLIAALNNMSVLGADILNAYLTAPTTEKVWTVLGAEWGSDTGKHAIIVRALYGLKTSGAAYRNHFALYLRSLGFTSCLANLDVWMRSATQPEGTAYYKYLMLYVDDLLAKADSPKAILDDVHLYFNLKPESVGHPNIYLGSKVSKARMANGVKCWCNSSSQYVKEAIWNTEDYIRRRMASWSVGKHGRLWK
jgi:hypothetical protein